MVRRLGRWKLYGEANGWAPAFGPAAATWFGFLQRRVRIPSSPNLEILARVGLDQGVFAGANLFCFLSSMALMEGTDPKAKLESTYVNALSKNWMVWPWVQIANFKFVPLEHRVLVVNVVSLGELQRDKGQMARAIANVYTGWNCYLSFLNSQGGANKEKDTDLPPS